jgi:hypothetical protein
VLADSRDPDVRKFDIRRYLMIDFEKEQINEFCLPEAIIDSLKEKGKKHKDLTK